MHLDDRAVASVLDTIPDQWSAAPHQPTAAVLVPIVRRAGTGDCVLFTERPEHMPTHAGQVSFPGGKREAKEDPLSCALRETLEEIGVPNQSVDPLGALPPRPARAGFPVEVCVGRLTPAVALRPDAREVARILEVPMARLLIPGNWVMREVRSKSQPGRVYLTPHFRWDGTWIWGLTGRMTLDLLTRLQPDFAIADP